MITKANPDAEILREMACSAEIGVTIEELSIQSVGKRSLFTQMPDEGTGYYCYGPLEKRYGLPEVVRAIAHICNQWQQVYPQGPRIGIGNISLQGGGFVPPHKSHQKGIDVDLRLVANINKEGGMTWRSPEYSKPRTQELVNLIRNNPHLNIRTILFNDPSIKGVSKWEGHDDHLHVSFYPPTVSASAFSSDQGSLLKMVKPSMKGVRVQALQQRLAELGFSVTADGIFGAETDAAVRAFQSAYGLSVDGMAGKMTLAALERAKSSDRQLQAGQLQAGQLQAGAQPLATTDNAKKPPTKQQTRLAVRVEQGMALAFGDLVDCELMRDRTLCFEVQWLLHANQYLKTVDGVYGPNTQAALRKFAMQHQPQGEDLLLPATLQALLSSRLAGGMLPNWAGGDQQATIEAIKQEANRQGITHPGQIAYILATVEHETAGKFQPVKECFFLGEPAAETKRKTFDYYPYYGRGYVQLTWDYNYRNYSTLLGLDLINQPDLVMQPDISLFILIDGMKRGTFTTRSLDDFMRGDKFDFVEARQIINGRDKAVEIASIANSWLSRTA
ncbi:MAG: penicillin-insensitive murein endopeptidase [Phormidesmis sp.]